MMRRCHARARGELLQVELEEEKLRVAGIVVYAVAAAVFLALAVVALFTFMACWNDFLGPLVYIQDEDQYTLALGLQAFQSAHGGTDFHYLMAASVMIGEKASELVSRT